MSGLLLVAVAAACAPVVLAGQDSVPSPRLRALGTSPSPEVLDAFLREVAAGGGPLVESWPEDSAKVLVTFLWRAAPGTREVVVAGSALGSDVSRNRLRAYAGTDLWWVSRVLPRDLRTVYRFAIDPPAGTTGSRTHARADPLNPKSFVFPRDPEVPGSTDYRISLLELPGATPQPWIEPRPDTPKGTVSTDRFTSRLLGNTRRVFTYLPPGYERGRGDYPLAIVFDGAAYLGMVPTQTVLDNLIAAGRIPPLVAVLVDNPDAATRSRELDCYPPFVSFVADELVPWIRSRLRVSRDPRRAVLAGSSGGGQASMCIGQSHPELFGNVLAQSGSFFAQSDQPIGDEWVYRHLVTGAKLPIRFYLDVGRFEPGFSVTGVRMMRNVLEARGYPLRYLEFSGGHDYAWWRGTLADGLIFLIGR